MRFVINRGFYSNHGSVILIGVDVTFHTELKIAHHLVTTITLLKLEVIIGRKKNKVDHTVVAVDGDEGGHTGSHRFY